MNSKNKNIIYYIAVSILAASVLLFFLSYGSIIGKEQKIDSKITVKLDKLKKIQKKIGENIKGIRNIGIAGLRYRYSFNEKSGYFISEIARSSKKCGVKLNHIKLIKKNKNKDAVHYIFDMSGYGKTTNIYLFIKSIEFNYKIELNKFRINKGGGVGGEPVFFSVISVYSIKKSAVLRNVSKLKNNVALPGNAGIINPFIDISRVKKTVNKNKFKPQKRKKNFPVSRKKMKKVYEYANKKLSKESKLKESNFYNKKGVSFFRGNNFSAALPAFKKAIILNPYNYKALSNAALDSYEMKSYDESIFYGKKALNRKNLWQINFILGLAYLHKRNFSEAESYFKQALKLNPSNVNIKYYLNISKNRR